MIKDLEDRIIYEKENVLVLDKPYNLPSTGRSLEDEDCLQFWLMKRNGAMVWSIHQLDADTSGINIFVTDKKLVSVYKKMIEKTNANKEYLAIVHGSPDWSTIEEFGAIGKIDDINLGIDPKGKNAHSKFTVLKRGEKHTLLRAQIFTGRTHQIRIHLSHLGHPIVGDEWYCRPPCTVHKRQALHCSKIQLLDSGEVFSVGLPKDLEELLLKLKIYD